MASALLRVISAIFSLSERKPLPAVCELVSNVFHAFSLVAAKVSNARFVCSMLIFIKSRKASGTSGFVNASSAMILSCPRNCPRPPLPGRRRLATFSAISSQVLTGHQAAHQKLLISKLSTARGL